MEIIKYCRNLIKESASRNPRIYDFLRKFYRTKNEEKLFLKNEAITLNAPFKIIQIGANDGLWDDPIREIVVENRCTALFVEADPVCFELLLSNYAYLQKGNLFFENLAVVPNHQESISFYSLSKKIRTKFSIAEQVKLARKASTNKEHLKKFLSELKIENVEDAVEMQIVKTRTLEELFSSYFIPDILVIDAEGIDWQLLNSINFRKHQPKIILFESQNVPDGKIEKEVLNKLEETGYKLEKFKYDIGCKHVIS